MAGEIERALTFMKAIGADPDEFHRVDFHSSHEALVLEYEHAMTRIDSRTELPYDVSGHFVWIGERTRQLDGAHVELLRHIRNPIGVKLGPTTTPDDALALAARLNPDNEPGRLTFITRFGAGKIRDGLPHLVEKVTAAGRRGGVGLRPDARQHLRGAARATRPAASTTCIDEVQGFFDVHRSLGTWPGGIHVELTGDDVTECVGGGEELLEVDLGAPLRVGLRPAAQPRAVPRAGLPRRRDAAGADGLTLPAEARREAVIDLRSDTLTRPTDAMRLAMARAEVGDDVYGEDPTVRALEERVAGLFGHEAALFTPTGSMANVLAVRSLVAPGQEVLCESRAHIARAELGAHGAYTGLTMRTWIRPARPGRPARHPRRCSPPTWGRSSSPTAAISVENTHNFAGGAVLPDRGPARRCASSADRRRRPRPHGRRPDLERARRHRRRRWRSTARSPT